MSNSVNMNLPVPSVGTTDGPDWADNINTCLTIIDSHDHASGSGVQITPSGISINADLPFGSNNATALRTTRFVAQSAALSLAADLCCVYAVDDDLYYNDGQGVQIQITANGAVAGTPGSIANLVSPATASYVAASSTFVFQSDVNTAANIDGASFLLRNSTASSKALTLAPPNAMSADYSLVLPPLPVSQKIMTLDSSGNITAPYVVDNSTLTISTNTIKVADSGITATQIHSDAVITAKIIDQAVTKVKQAAVPTAAAGSDPGAGGFAISTNCLSQTITSSTYVYLQDGGPSDLVANLTTTGRPVRIELTTSDTGGGALSGFFSAGGYSIQIVQDGVGIAAWQGGSTVFSTAICFISVVAAGTHQYKISVKKDGSPSVLASNLKITAYEI